MTAKQAYDLLTAFYRAEVVYRHRNYEADKDCQGALKQFASALTADNAKFGVMLCGKPGNGKTTLLYAFREAVKYARDAGWAEINALPKIVSAKDVCIYAKSNEPEFLAIKKYPILAIDEIGGEPAEIMQYGNILNPVIDILEYRYNEQLPTYMTTNLDAGEIREKYGDRIADRFNEMLTVIIFQRKSYRDTPQ